MTFQSLTCRTKNDMRLMHLLPMFTVLHRPQMSISSLFWVSQQTYIKEDHMLHMPGILFTTHQRLQRLHTQILLVFHPILSWRPLLLHGFILWLLRKKHFSTRWTNLNSQMKLSTMCTIHQETMTLHTSATMMLPLMHVWLRSPQNHPVIQWSSNPPCMSSTKASVTFDPVHWSMSNGL